MTRSDPSANGREDTEFMYIKNKRGPRTDPCGTPDRTWVSGDEAPSTTTYCFLLVRYEATHWMIWGSRLISFSLLRSGQCGTLSKAFWDRRRLELYTSAPDWRSSSIVCSVDRRAVMVDLPGVKPHWEWESKFLSARWSEMMKCMCLSRILLTTGSSEMGL